MHATIVSKSFSLVKVRVIPTLDGGLPDKTKHGRKAAFKQLWQSAPSIALIALFSMSCYIGTLEYITHLLKTKRNMFS